MSILEVGFYHTHTNRSSFSLKHQIPHLGHNQIPSMILRSKSLDRGSHTDLCMVKLFNKSGLLPFISVTGYYLPTRRCGGSHTTQYFQYVKEQWFQRNRTSISPLYPKVDSCEKTFSSLSRTRT